MLVVFRNVGMVAGHTGKIIHRRIPIDYLIHVAAEAVRSRVNAAESKQPVENSGEAEIQIGGMGSTQAASEGDNAGIAIPAVSCVHHIPHEGRQFIHNKVNPLLIPADAPVSITVSIRPGFRIDGVNGEHHHLPGVNEGSPGIRHVEIFKVEESTVLTGDKQHRSAGVTVDLDFHVPTQCRAVLLKVLRFHTASSFRCDI